MVIENVSPIQFACILCKNNIYNIIFVYLLSSLWLIVILSTINLIMIRMESETLVCTFH